MAPERLKQVALALLLVAIVGGVWYLERGKVSPNGSFGAVDIIN